jgi:hypothetical protein
VLALLGLGKSRRMIASNSYSIISWGTPSRAIRRVSLVISCTISSIAKDSIVVDR